MPCKLQKERPLYYSIEVYVRIGEMEAGEGRGFGARKSGLEVLRRIGLSSTEAVEIHWR